MIVDDENELCVPVSGGDLVDEVSQMIAECLHIERPFVLFYEETLLQPDMPLEFYSLT